MLIDSRLRGQRCNASGRAGITTHDKNAQSWVFSLLMVEAPAANGPDSDAGENCQWRRRQIGNREKAVHDRRPPAREYVKQVAENNRKPDQTDDHRSLPAVPLDRRA